jgi:hypothetical protein
LRPTGDLGEVCLAFSLSIPGEDILLLPYALVPLFKSPKSKEPFLYALLIAEASVFEKLRLYGSAVSVLLSDEKF